MEDKLWTNEELKKLEEALPRVKECKLEKASRGVPGEEGTKWKVAATSMHDDVLFDTEESHE